MADHGNDHDDHDDGHKKKKGGHGGGHGGGGGHEEGGGGHGAPLWVVSFCDMTILEMSFFVILLAGSSQKSSTDDDLLKMLASIKAGFGYVPKADSTDELDMAVLQILAHKKSKITSKNQIRWSNPAVTGEQLRDRDLWVRVKGSVGKPIIFEESSADIPLNWEPQVDEIATVLRHHFRQIVIQGHCSLAESERDPQGGHEIAFRRALAVKTALQQRGIAASKMRLVSCAHYDTFRESKSTIQRRAVVTLGTYYLPGQDQLMEDLTPIPGQEPSSSRKAQ